MLFSGAEDLEDKIIKLTLKQPATIKFLYTSLHSADALSLRAVYKAIERLVASKVLIKVGKRVVVDEEWVRRVGEGLQTTPITMPSRGEKIAYTFVSMDRVDAFWKTVMLPIEESLSPKEIFFYNPHNFWAYLPERRESEDRYYQHFKETGRHGFLTIGGESEADKQTKRDFQSDYFQIDVRNISVFKRTDHFTLIDPFIVTGRLSKATAHRIDALYSSGGAIKDIFPEVLEIARRPGSIKFIIENNPAKAKKLRKLLAKNFYFKRDML